MKLLKLILIGCVVLGGLSGCKFHGAPKQIKPGAWILDQVPEHFPAKLKKAWLDGCNSGMGSMTNSFYRSFYRFQQDPRLRKDVEYYKVWKDTYNFCRHYTYGVIREGDVRFKLAVQDGASGFSLGKTGGWQMGGDIFNKGLLRMSGPDGEGVVLANFGQIDGGTHKYWGEDQLNWDYRDHGWATKSSESSQWNMDFRPSQDSGFLGDSTIDGWK